MVCTHRYIPAVAICYFMIGFPGSSFGFMIALIFVATFAGEAIPTLVAQFTKSDASKALMVTQGLLLIFFIFAGVWMLSTHGTVL